MGHEEKCAKYLASGLEAATSFIHPSWNRSILFLQPDCKRIEIFEKMKFLVEVDNDRHQNRTTYQATQIETIQQSSTTKFNNNNKVQQQSSTTTTKFNNNNKVQQQSSTTTTKFNNNNNNKVQQQQH
jgi:hypothetical protein